MRAPTVALAMLLVSTSFAQRNPFASPPATMHYAPDRVCHLAHLRVDLDVDYPDRTFTGRSENTMVPLQDGVTQVVLMAGTDLDISSVQVNGQKAPYSRDDQRLLITTPPLRKGTPIVIAIDYKSVNARGTSFGGGGGGFHWIRGTDAQPNHVGFWTQGETEFNREWAPTWDYPNDLTTSETHCTVPADWTVVGNGRLTSNSLSSDGKRRTFVWKMDLPHATYLLSLVGGPFDIVRDSWRGVPLMYVVPKGEGTYAPYTFSGTKDMLSFYSDTLGFKYPWPKYAQDAMFDFGGGMENVSATTMQEGVLTEERNGFRTGDSLISHEMAHQWFGDTVTCKDWGDTFLNETFATFMQMLYFEHSRGKNGYDQEVDNNTQGYISEARRFERPISTKLYTTAENMFGSGTTYDKGGVVMHTLRRQIGDANLFAGLNLYLRTNQHTPVQASQLCRAITEACGINCEPFFDQWFFKPGHPKIEYSWTWDQASASGHVTVKQTQDTSNGTPIYDIPMAKIGVFVGGRVIRVPIHLQGPTTEVAFSSNAKPDAVLLDPDHDFLREIADHTWTHDELRAIVAYGPEGGDRTIALRQLLDGTPSDDDVRLAVKAVQADVGLFPSFRTIAPLTNLERADLRPFFESLLDHPNYARRAEAVVALSRLPADPGTVAKLRAQINDKAPIAVVVDSIHALAEWDAKGNADVFRKALNIPSRSDRIKRAAEGTLQPTG